jgi:hypothetical protein
VSALSALVGRPLRIGDYQEHVLGEGGAAASRAVAYIELVVGPGKHLYGAGVAPSIVDASFRAVLSAVGRAAERGWIEPPAAGGNREVGEQKAPRPVRRRGGPPVGRR